MVFLNYNKIFDIDILNLETACNTTVTILITWCSSWVHWNGGQFEVDFGLFYPIYAVKGKEISIFLKIWTRKYVEMWNRTCTWSDTIRPCQNIHRNAPGGEIFNFQIALDRASNEIRMKIQTENFFGILISTRLVKEVNHFMGFCNWHCKISYTPFLSSCYGTLVCVLQLETALATLVTTWFTLADRRWRSRYRSSDQCILNAFRSPERYNGWFREQLGQRFTFFNFFPMMTDNAWNFL
jgi:hypothetical protein